MENNNTNWKLCVRCYTYNQEAYILDALNGFVMQQTDFPFVCCIVDDASTDGEQDLIMNYVEENFDLKDSDTSYIREEDYGTVVFCRHKINKSCYFVVLLLKVNHNATPDLKKLKRSYISRWEKSCEYEALCEGDDYWIDPLKLQKQVDFLDANSDYVMSYSNAIRLYNDTGERFNLSCGAIDSISQLLCGNTIVTATVLIRHNLLDYFNNSQIRKDLGNQRMGDYQLWLWAALNGKIHHLDELTTVYRILPSSASHGSFSYWIKFLLSATIIKDRFAQEIKIDTTAYNFERVFYELMLAYDEGDEECKNKTMQAIGAISSRHLSIPAKIKKMMVMWLPTFVYSLMKRRYQQEVHPTMIYIITQRLYRKVLKIK